MTVAGLAWAVRSVMVAGAAIATYALAQTELVLEPWQKFACGAFLVAVAALNPTTLAERFSSGDDPA